ncbi:MAG: hypothetical protein LAO51_02600 [Acidobacteriia bacterium]|nr:hypothetical protein [Terriglobia bacterium]
MRGIHALRALAVALPWLAAASAQGRDLTFEERLKAQEAIERVYYSHQIDATQAVEAAVPREVLERKVRTYLAQSSALESYWRVPVSATALRNEIERIARSTRFPDRLREIYAALGNDTFLVQECLARATLVDRWSRSLFAFDRGLHEDARRRAEQLRAGLASGAVAVSSPDPRLREAEVIEVPAGTLASAAAVEIPSTGGEGPVRLRLAPEAFRRWRALSPARVGEIGPVAEEADGFVIRVVLAEQAGRARVAVYTVPKRAWDNWWKNVEQDLAGREVRAVASASDPLPAPRAGGDAGGEATCLPGDSWDNGSLGAVPEGRTLATAVWTGRVVVFWGGVREGRRVRTGGRYDPVTDTWSATSTIGAPDARYGHSAVWSGDRMIVWGGLTDSGYVATGGRYDPVSDNWSPTSESNAPSVRWNHTASWSGTVMVVWGGDHSDIYGQHFLDTGGRYDPVVDAWMPISSAGAARGRSYHSAVWTGHTMVVWGGYWSDGTTTYLLDTGGRYDPSADTWTPISTAGAPSPRFGHAAVWTGAAMVVWGGHDYTDLYGATHFLGTGGRYDPAADAWTPMSTTGAPAPRSYHSAVWTGCRFVVWGGQGDGGLLDTGGRYDPLADAWTPTSTSTPPTGRSSASSVWTGSEMVIWGGGTAGGVYPETGGRYDPALDRWTPTYAPNSPVPRQYPSSIWTGSLMIVFGGLRSEEPVSTGGRYDPLTDSWSPTADVGPNRSRVFHTAVWTGSRMIIWGGEPCPYSVYDYGMSYDPVSDAWTPIQYLSEPTPRRHHTAVWTGDTMIVWGGLVCDPPYVATATGGRYDPMTDSWGSISTTKAPSARQYHTAVWTGSRMLVWGGSVSDANPNYFNSGSAYDPVHDSWSAITKGGAPSPRAFHTTVWTGDSMIVWGGTGPSDFDTGGIYDPGSNRWNATSLASAPAARIGHTAVWTGKEMIVWGGETSAAGLDRMDTGARYDPVADRWSATSLYNAPSGRTDHASVWSGSFMIVWGGVGDYLPSSGGRYVADNPDDDGDGTANICDCSPTDSTVASVPREVTGLWLAADKATVSWDSAAPGAGTGTVHDVLRGSLDGFPVGAGQDETCLAAGISGASASDAFTPPAGAGFWYLVRGRNTCGTGTYGFRSGGVERTSTACP